MGAGLIAIGCAGWSLPKAVQARFPPGESHLARHAARFPVVEINSSYEDALLQALAARLRQAADEGLEVWCIFDNTASGAAIGNALALQELVAM